MPLRRDGIRGALRAQRQRQRGEAFREAPVGAGVRRVHRSVGRGLQDRGRVQGRAGVHGQERRAVHGGDRARDAAVRLDQDGEADPRGVHEPRDSLLPRQGEEGVLSLFARGDHVHGVDGGDEDEGGALPPRGAGEQRAEGVQREARGEQV